MQIRQPDMDGKYLTKSIVGKTIISCDSNGYLMNAEPVNFIKKGLHCKYGEILEYSDKIVILKKNGTIYKSDREKLNNHLTKSIAVTEPETPVIEVTGTFDTVAGKVKVEKLNNDYRIIFTDPDLVKTERNNTIFIKSIGNKRYYAVTRKMLFGDKLLKSLHGEELKKKHFFVKGIKATFTAPKLPKPDQPPKVGGVAWNVKGGQKPIHKYLERKPNPKGEGYIYLYELPDGSKEWKDEAGKVVDAKLTEYKIDFNPGDAVQIGDKVGKIKEASDNFLAINIDGEIRLINKTEHLQKIKDHSNYKQGDHVKTEAGEGTLIQVTDNLALLKTDTDNKLKVIHLEKQIKPYNKTNDKANINKYSKVYQGYGEQEQENDVKEIEQIPEYREFQDAATKAGLGSGELERKKYVKVGNVIRTVRWKFNKAKNGVDFIIDGVPDLQLSFMGDKYYIRDINDDGYSLENMQGERGLFLSHKDYDQYKPDTKDEEVEFEKNVDHLGSMLVKYPKRTFHFSGELSPEQEERIAEIKLRETGYKQRWKTKEDKIQTAAEIDKIKKENEIKKDEIKAILGSKEYESFKKKADERGFNFGENKLTAGKTVNIEGKKFDIRVDYDSKAGEKINIDGPAKELRLGENNYPITDITNDEVYYDDNGKEKNISVEDLKSINGRSIFEPTKASKGLISSNKAQKFYFGTDDKNTASGYYEVVEAKDIIASHLPGGEANQNYNIGNAQNRDRSAPQSLAQINKIAANPNFDFLADSRTAQDGAPIVNADYNVIAGNGRAIGMQLHYQTGKEKYKNDLLKKAEELGFAKDDIATMKEPILVRRVNVDDKEAQRLGALSNTSNMLATEGREEAKGKATRIDDRTFNNLADIFKNAKGNHSSISEYLDEVGADIVKELSEKGIIPENERHLYYNASSGKLDASHKDKVKQLLTQSILGDSSQHFENIPDAAREGITKGLGELFALKGQQGDLIPHLQNAVKMLAKYDAQKSSFANPDDWIAQAQNDMLEPLTGNKKDLAMFELLTNTRPNDIKNSFKEYVRKMEGDMFEPGMDAEEAFDSVFKPKYINGVNKSLWKRVRVFGKRLAKAIDTSKNILLPSKKNPTVRRWQSAEEKKQSIDKNKERDIFVLQKMIMQDDKKLKKLKNWEECYIYDPEEQTRKYYLRGDASSINIPDDIANNSKGCIFSHNHPNGAPFSANDIFMMLSAKLKTMRAVGTNGNLYVMTIVDQEVFDKYANVSRNELLQLFNNVYNDAYNLEYDEYVKKVRENTMTRYQAQFYHFNDIWKKIAPQLGCKYEVRVNYVD